MKETPPPPPAPLEWQPQEPPFDHPDSCCRFRLDGGKHVVATRAANHEFTREEILFALTTLQREAVRHDGLDYLQVFKDARHRVLWVMVALLEAARRAAARSVNAIMTATYWEIGRRIVEQEQKGKRRAGYGETLVEQLSLDLTDRFGRGFGRSNLFQMRAFYEAYSQIVQTPSG